MKLVAVFTTIPSPCMPWRSVESYIYGREFLRRREAFHVEWTDAGGIIMPAPCQEAFERKRQKSIDKTREKITDVDRKTILTELGDIYRHEWDQDLLRVIDRYLLACYPAIIPNPISVLVKFINKWVGDCDFSNMTMPMPITNDHKIHHTGSNCVHVSRGSVTICGKDVPAEQCADQHYPHFIIATNIMSVFTCASRIAYAKKSINLSRIIKYLRIGQFIPHVLFHLIM